MKACNEITNNEISNSLKDCWAVYCKRKRKPYKNHTNTQKCHGQDQQTAIDEILFGKIN